MRLPYTELWAGFEVVRPFRLPYHSGSMFRGVLGHALRRFGCARFPTGCRDDCPSDGGCLFPRLLQATAVGQGGTKGGRYGSAIRLVPIYPEPGAQSLLEGDIIGFGVRVVGDIPAVELGRLMGALEGVAAFPLADEGRVTFRSLTQSGPRNQTFDMLGRGRDAPARLHVVFETPVWLTFRGDYVKSIDFSALYMASLGRFAALYTAYGSDNEDLAALFDAKGRAMEVVTVEERFSDLQWARHSNRTDTRHALRGLLGSVTYEGDLRPFWGVLQAGALLHVGKSPAFGLGRFRLETDADRTVDDGAFSLP